MVSANPTRPKWSRWRKIFAVLGALILVFVGVYVVYGYLDGLPPEVVSSGGTGQMYLDAALMTFYTPTVPGATNFNVSVTADFASGWQFPFTWANISGTALPVRFLLAPSTAFEANSTTGFIFTDGVTTATWIGVERPEPPGALVSLWSMEYSVRQMSVWEGFSKVSWMEVDYSLTPVSLDIGAPLPVANVSVPSAAQILATGLTDSLNQSVAPGYLWSLSRDLANFPPPPVFHHALPAVTFDAGSAGSFTASLTSSFRWGKGDDYKVVLSGSGSMHGSLTWYWDARFGSLYTVFSA